MYVYGYVLKYYLAFMLSYISTVEMFNYLSLYMYRFI